MKNLDVNSASSHVDHFCAYSYWSIIVPEIISFFFCYSLWTYPFQAALARLEALESDNAGVEVVDLNDDEYGSTDEEDPG